MWLRKIQWIFREHQQQASIHTSIVSRHLATRGNKKILHTPPPHIGSSEEILPTSLVAPLSNSEQINYIPKIILNTKSIPNHIHQHCAPPPPCSSHTHTTHIIALTAPSPHMHHIVTPGFVDRPRWGGVTAGQMDREAC